MTPASFTVVGANGFIGSHVAAHLRASGHQCHAVARTERWDGRPLGHVVFCAGVTGDFRARPLDTIDAHVGALADLVRAGTFDSLVYLSSTRVYKRHETAPAHEEDEIGVCPQDADDLYGVSKLTGEAIALSTPCGYVARLSNVYGEAFDQPGFLYTILKDAVSTGRIELQTSAESSRDFVAIDDVVPLLVRIALGGDHRIYNVASGANLTSGELAHAIAALTGATVRVPAGAPTITFPRVDIGRIRSEFGASPRRLLDDLPGLVDAGGRHWSRRAHC
jgi:nucleoside-diphosphate-sugar epimerase